jgi:hypothetical protein
VSHCDIARHDKVVATATTMLGMSTRETISSRWRCAVLPITYGHIHLVVLGIQSEVAPSTLSNRA